MPHHSVHDIQIYYETHGSPGNPALLLVHGLGSSTRDWEMQIPAFEKDYHVLTVDVRGHGRSGKPKGPYGVAVFAADIAGLLDALRIEKVHLVGISMGGMIALQMALDFPQRLRSVTVVNATASIVPTRFVERVAIWMRFVIVYLYGMRKMGEVLAKRLFLEPEQEEIRRMFVERWAENDRDAYVAVMRGLVGWDVSSRVGSIQTPTLLIASDQDYTPLEYKQTLVSQIPGAKLTVIENAHHAVTVERPELFNTALRAFLQSVKMD